MHRFHILLFAFLIVLAAQNLNALLGRPSTLAPSHHMHNALRCQEKDTQKQNAKLKNMPKQRTR